jgi:hypothetical protein
MKTLIKLVAVSVMIFFGLQTVNAQSTKSQKKAAKEAWVKKKVDEKNYVFKADFADPQGGGRRTLTDDYDFVVAKDSVIAFLPYFGRAYMAPTDPSEGGIKFTSTNFDYEATRSKNGNWDILIKPREKNGTDWRDVQSLRLTITTSGYASLSVISTNRSYISFDGRIEERGKR